MLKNEKKKEIGIKDFLFHLEGDFVRFEPNTKDAELAEMIALWRQNRPEIDNDRTAVGLMFAERVSYKEQSFSLAIMEAIEAGRYEIPTRQFMEAVDCYIDTPPKRGKMPQSLVRTIAEIITPEIERRLKQLTVNKKMFTK